MTSEVVLLISILCLVKSTWCGNYGFAMGKRHLNDQILHQELLTSDSNEAIIEHVYVAEKPVTYMQLHTDTNIYTEVSLINSTKMFIKLFNFEHLRFNATLTVYGYPWHPDGPAPDDDIDFLLQPNRRKAMYLNKSSVEESGLIATNGAYVSEELNATHEDDDSNVAKEVDDDSSAGKFYDYDFTSTSKSKQETTDDEEKRESIINCNVTLAESRSVGVKVNFLNLFSVWIVFVSLLR